MNESRRTFLKTTGSLAAISTVALSNTACGPLPDAPKFPYYGAYRTREAVIDEARRMSDRLHAHIDAWFAGRAADLIPASLLPSGRPPAVRDFRLVRPEEIDSEEQWVVREAHAIDWDAVPSLFPDPHATYLLLPYLWTPVETRVHFEGEFPWSRYFSIQVTPPFEPENYRYEFGGAPEVPIFDCDIEPLPGHVNPFRTGADRHARKRSYKVTYEMAIGDPVALNGSAYTPPDYRAAGNTRYGGAIIFQGPWADPQFKNGKHPGHKRGLWNHGEVWVRYYAPDRAKGARAGVEFPKVTYELPDGRRFFIRADIEQISRDLNKIHALPRTPPAEPQANTAGARVGWGKMWGIPRSGLAGLATTFDKNGLFKWALRPYIRDVDRGIFGRGEEVAPPGNYEPSNTTAAGINYLNRSMAIGAGKIFVLTGRLPATPHTRDGEARMGSAQARYWSLTSYDPHYDIENPSRSTIGSPVTSIMDDEIVTDADGRYVIVYSRSADRPANARAENGVTWVDWGPVAFQLLTLRWMSIAPEWTFERAPDERNLGWETDWAAKSFRREVIGRNDRAGFLGEYQPVVHYMKTADFEVIGERVTPDLVLVWGAKKSGQGRNARSR